jgi:hypothetical protein
VELLPEKIVRAVELGYTKLESYRRHRTKFISRYVGNYYGKNVSDESAMATPLNLMYSAVMTIVPNLVYQDPRFTVKTNVLPYRQYAQTLGLALDHLVTHEIMLRRTLRKAIVDAMFGVAIVKVGLSISSQTLDLGEPLAIGYPYADRVDLDDYVCDPVARDADEFEFEGHRFRMSEQQAIEAGLPGDMVKKLCSHFDGGNAAMEVSAMSDNKGAQKSFNDEVSRYIDMTEIYFPREQMVVTIPHPKYGDSYARQIINQVEWAGPERGPYHRLGFAYVPDNPLPVPPASIWMDLHDLANRVGRKIARQANRNKRVLAYTGNAEEDARAIADSADGETIRVEDVEAVKEIEFGGATDDSYEFLDWTQKKFSEMTGNIDLLSGTDTNQPTATQAEMLQANTSVRLADMQSLVYQFTGDIGRALAFYIHTDPLIELPLVKRVGGQEIQVAYTPEMREGEFLDYAIETTPFSMARTDPNMKLRRKMEFITNAIPALAQAFQILGPAFNIEAALVSIARDMDIEDADEFINSQMLMQQVMMQMQMAGNPDGKAGGAQPQQMGGGLGAGMKLGQPNPGAQGPTGGITPDTEQAMAQQEVAGELQSTYRQPSSRALAMSM